MIRKKTQKYIYNTKKNTFFYSEPYNEPHIWERGEIRNDFTFFREMKVK